MVMLMTPGVAFFYGGMVRRKNFLSTLMMCFVTLGLIGLLWVIYGDSLSFGPDKAGIIGGLNFVGLLGVGQTPSSVYATTIPQLAFAAFQMMFAVITVALITGAVVERIKFSSLLVFSALWFTLVYCPVTHWVWGGGWLEKMGFLDFAGGSRAVTIIALLRRAGVVTIGAEVAQTVTTAIADSRTFWAKGMLSSSDRLRRFHPLVSSRPLASIGLSRIDRNDSQYAAHSAKAAPSHVCNDVTRRRTGLADQPELTGSWRLAAQDAEHLLAEAIDVARKRRGREHRHMRRHQ